MKLLLQLLTLFILVYYNIRLDQDLKKLYKYQYSKEKKLHKYRYFRIKEFYKYKYFRIKKPYI